MRLLQWIQKEIGEGKGTQHVVLLDLEERSQVSLATLRSVARGMRLRRYEIAKAVSIATGGEVSITELCEDDVQLPKEGEGTS